MVLNTCNRIEKMQELKELERGTDINTFLTNRVKNENLIRLEFKVFDLYSSEV
jgi:hypothetical protein